MGVEKVEDLIAFQQARAFKREVYAIVRKSEDARRSLRYREQLFDAASGVEANMAEGWRRYAPADMNRFFRYALASLEEAKVRLLDGVDRGYFSRGVCEPALVHAKRCSKATQNFIRSRGGE